MRYSAVTDVCPLLHNIYWAVGRNGRSAQESIGRTPLSFIERNSEVKVRNMATQMRFREEEWMATNLAMFGETLGCAFYQFYR